MTLRESAASGSRLAALKDLRDILAEQIEGCESLRDLAALSARFQSVIAEISDLEAVLTKTGDPIDEIGARRSARGAVTATRSRRSVPESF